MGEIVVGRLQEYSDRVAEGLGSLMPHLSKRFADEPIDEALLRSILSSPFHEQFVAEETETRRIVGAATLSLTMGAAAGSKAYLEDFVTHPDVRRAGVGHSLWEAMIGWCTARGVSELGFTSNESRAAAHAFYLDHGAEIHPTTVFRVPILHQQT